MLKRILSGLFRSPQRRASALAGCAGQAFRKGDTGRAIELYRAALHLAPRFSSAHNELGIALQFVGDVVAARHAFEQAIDADSALGAAHYNLALLSLETGDPERAGTCLEMAARQLGDRPEISAARGRLAAFAGDMESAARYYAAAWEADPAQREAADSYLLALASLADAVPRTLASEHRRIGERYPVGASPLNLPAWNRDPERPLTIAYLSPDFREHSVRYFFEPLLAHHDRGRFRIVCYNDSARGDAYTASVRTRCDLWREVAGRPDERLAEVVAADRVDILVELAGHTAGNRMSVLARRLAPIQISGLGYPPTTGVPNIDYKFSDPVADPPGAEAWYSERLLRLPDTFWCYTPPPDCPAPAPAPCIDRGAVTFGCYGNLGKIGPDCLAAWRRILAAVPDSRLRVKSIGLGTAWSDGKFRQRLTNAGIDHTRVELEGASAGRAFQQAYAHVDLVLDTFPFNGGTTTAHALWMSVPVLTLAGELLLSRMGASMLRSCGHTELVADSWDDYVGRAVALARDPARLARLRTGLRDAVARSPLCDGPAHVAAVEAAYRRAWRSWCDEPMGKDER